MTAIIDLQQAYEQPDEALAAVPAFDDLQTWADCAFAALNLQDLEFTVRIVDEEESQSLNFQYRNKDKSTNVLSFPFECPPGVELNLLGDLVVCAPVILREAQEQNKDTDNHYAHMIIHGLLHLLGYDHIEDADAEEMEALEIAILSQLGIDDPYQEH
ncbi:rRNA maturation RNase YbeY [Alteromonas pelagimontana]|uniref:Endoribonuclease YbeY n=1 Tax=Alteromonas pelagimontana TaxID=1858656 RepID=A0A6M4M966_9ALTE|nr:rRNA maturation RNase YbeY [Alteromonas pelagimontana]QJR79714.1 rRNA maturation RNase YbeY [Alteromonas pelagimontana]